jgi:hypothetical protein
MECKVCGSPETEIIFKNNNRVPIISNLVYDSKKEAESSPVTSFNILHCQRCDFVFEKNEKNTIFDSSYDNAQQDSNRYIEYIQETINDINKLVSPDSKIVEIGCGNGYLVDQLSKLNIDSYGFDPSYSGNNKKIFNRYYNESDTVIKPDIIILRHMLDYVEKPIDFLHSLAKMHNDNSILYIEVPSYDFIKETNSWIDFNGERYSYFSKNFFNNIFTEVDIKETFNKQYLTVIANIKDLKKIKPSCYVFKNNLLSSFDKTKKFIENLDNIALWGASGKGVIASNLLDKSKNKIKYLIDINKNKIGKFVGGGYEVIGVEDISNFNIKNIIIMNDIYYDEIKELLSKKKILINIFTISKILKG